MKSMKLFLRGLLVAAGVLAVSSIASASHSWNGYHWARTTSSFTLKVVDSVTPNWDSPLNDTISMWSQSTVIDLAIASSDDSSHTRRRCTMVTGQVRVCNDAYGRNGWLGLATIGLDSNGHIDQGTAQMNDSYSSSWTPEEMNHVMCQEVGHTFGLDHQSTDGSSQATCMDYSTDPASQWPNQHDYDELQTIYSHLDSYNSYDDGTGSGGGTCHGKKCQGPVGVPMGILVHRGAHSETWVATRAGGGYWVHHVLLAPGHSRSNF